MPHTSAPSCELRAGHAEERRLQVTKFEIIEATHRTG